MSQETSSPSTRQSPTSFLLAFAKLLVPFAAGLGTVYAAQAIRDSSDTQTELIERHEKEKEAVVKKQEAESRRRAETRRRKFEEISKVTRPYYAALSRQYRKELDLVEASSKAVGKILDKTIDNNITRRWQLVDKVRKAQQDETYIGRIEQIEQETFKLKELLTKWRFHADPFTDEGLKSLEQRREAAERMETVAEEIKRTLGDAFDQELFESFGIAETMKQLDTRLQEAMGRARMDWSSILAGFEQRLKKLGGIRLGSG